MILQIWKYTKGSRKFYFPIGLCLLFSTIESLLTPYLISQIIDQSISNKDLSSLLEYISIILVVSIIGYISMIVSQNLTVKLEREITLKIREECLDCICKQSGEFYTYADSSDLLTLVLQDVESIADILARQLLTMAYNFIKIIGVLFLIFKLQNNMSIVMIGLILLMIFLQISSNKKIEKTTLDSRHSIIKLQSSLQELIMNLMNFVQNGLIIFQNKKIKRNEDDFTRAKINTTLAMAKYNSLMNFISSIITVTIVGWGGFNVITQLMTIGDLFSFQVYTQRLISPVMSMLNISADLASSYVSWDRLNTLLTRESTIKDSGKLSCEINGQIQFSDVSFGYNQTEILSKASFTVNEGTIHAIVGPSGAGKTTIIQLIFRLWEPLAGTITLDGRRISEYTLDCLRRQISIVSQNIFLLNDTIYNNIVLNKESVTDQEVERALKGANIYDLVHGLKDGWHTVIGENGIRLSGGEKQRLAIARAIFKDAPIMVFDEATSMLDNNTEHEITDQILSLFKGKTIIIIAHRLSTIRGADIISVLKEGQIIERGTHHQLMQEEEFYYRLYTTS
ncbi:ABC transporter ATP-binding protein [Paenibacillus sp. FSL H8-0282]|uniref:ABC transporter ATP-binding protein n=1 Tax=unclassified Paenibacillus TaxID=185978 RepID=UPI0030D7A41B